MAAASTRSSRSSTPAGTALVYSTYLGGSGYDMAAGSPSTRPATPTYGITGTAGSGLPDAPQAASSRTPIWRYDAFVTKLNAGRLGARLFDLPGRQWF